MPMFEFKCKNCDVVYEELTNYDARGKFPGVVCPECGSKKKTKITSCCNFQFADPVGTDRYNGSHDYRCKHKQPQVRAERAAAEAASKVGVSPYNAINDLNSDKNFDFGGL